MSKLSIILALILFSLPLEEAEYSIYLPVLYFDLNSCEYSEQFDENPIDTSFQILASFFKDQSQYNLIMIPSFDSTESENKDLIACRLNKITNQLKKLGVEERRLISSEKVKYNMRVSEKEINSFTNKAERMLARSKNSYVSFFIVETD